MPATLTYRIVNVFTQGDDPFSGNPLCVFEDAAGLDTERMQALALQFNLSETTFILPSTEANARVRIFTPHYEMPFAGHPTLGTAHVCRAMGLGGNALTLQMQAGIIPVHASGRRWTLEAKVPAWREVNQPREFLGALLGLEASDIDERPLWVQAGTEQLIIPLKSEAAVRRATPRPEMFSRLGTEGGAGMAYVFAPFAGAGGTTANTAAQPLLARFFFPQGSAVLEDPATGSATANLGGWCLAMGRPLPCEFALSQGEYTGRPSSLHLRVDAGRRIFVSGEVMELGRGTIDLSR